MDDGVDLHKSFCFVDVDARLIPLIILVTLNLLRFLPLAATFKKLISRFCEQNIWFLISKL